MNHAKTSFSTEICAGAIISVVQYLAPLRVSTMIIGLRRCSTSASPWLARLQYLQNESADVWSSPRALQSASVRHGCCYVADSASSPPAICAGCMLSIHSWFPRAHCSSRGPNRFERTCMLHKRLEYSVDQSSHCSINLHSNIARLHFP
jgi:hypothetical protein